MLITVTKHNNCKYISLSNTKGMEVTLSTLGASLYSIKINNEFMTSSPLNKDDFELLNNYHGKTIGAIANRVNKGLVTINNKTYQMECNEESKTLHGGYHSLSASSFKYKIKENKGYVSVSFTYLKSDMLDGLPGEIKYKIIYKIYEHKNDIKIIISAVSNKDTVVALTNHTFYCLGDENISHLYLKIPSEKYIDVDKYTLLPICINNIYNVMNFNQFKRIRKDINDEYLQNSKTKGYDHCYLLSKNKIALKNKKYSMTLKTNFEAAQIYTDNYRDDYEMTNTKKYSFNRSIAIEPQDSLINREVLKSGEKYLRHISLSFKTK